MVNDTVLRNTEDLFKYYKHKLCGCNDGKDLELADAVQNMLSWIDNPTGFIKGRDYIDYIELQINALPSAIRVICGSTNREKLCKNCNSRTETTYHMQSHSWYEAKKS